MKREAGVKGKTMSAPDTEAKPFHHFGNFRPVTEELTATDLDVEGSLPPELTGLYVRQTANPRVESPHWFLGEGMVHGVRLEAGRAAWYRNRYVRTAYFDNPDAPRISDLGEIDYTLARANTHVLKHGGKILALEEGSFPYALDDELNTLGCHDFDGKLKSAFSAHPKICPVTGEMISFGYGQLPPYLTYLRVSPEGELVQSEIIEVGGPTMMHDFAVSERHALFMDLPVIFSMEEALKGSMPFHWSDNYPARIGVMPRTGGNADVKWFDVEPCFIFHTFNAYDEGDTVVLDACRHSEAWRDAGEMQGEGKLTLHRFTFDMVSGNVKEETLDDASMEFPRVADGVVGLKNRYGFSVRIEPGDSEQPDFMGLLKVDFQTGARELHEFPASQNAAEAIFVPAEGADPNSDEGYVMSYVYDEDTNGSEFVVLDASNFKKDPIARVKLPQRVPFGFHGSWISE
jgi:carotenoid cleavage dioxygenase-like enzyme